jgi:hypothetical protein
MRILSGALLTLSAQWLLGVLLFSTVAWLIRRLRGRRRWLATWTASARILRSAAPYAAIVALVGAATALLLPGGPARALTGIWSQPIWFVGIGALPAASCQLMVHAGRLEARGRLRAAKRQARLAGELFFLGAQAQLVLVWAGLLLLPGGRRTLILEARGAVALLLAAMAAWAAAACIAVIGGLARKPRPSGQVATFLYLFGIVGLIATYQLTLAP